MAFAALETEMRQDDILGGLPPVHELLAASTKAGKAGLTNRFMELYPVMREYVENRCFGREIDMEAASLRSYLA